MKTADWVKVLGVGIALLLVVNVVMFALRLVSWVLFWGVIILGAIVAYKVIPTLNKK
jgi:hypothetical protein